MHHGQERMGSSSKGLSDRELQVLEMVAQGEPITIIGQRLGISAATVKSHLNRIYRKIGARNRVEAASFYQRNLTCDSFRT